MNGSYSLVCSPTYPMLPNGKAPNLSGRIQLGSASEMEVRDFSRPPNSSPGCNGPHTNGCGGNNVLATVNASLLLNGSINSKIGGLGKNGYPAGLTSPDPRIQRQESVSCCLPSGCLRGFDDSVFPDNVKELVRIGCDNPLCQEPKWMHPECFREWQIRQSHLGKLPKRTRHFSDKDVLSVQSIMSWNKRDFDQEAKLNACRCGKGSLRHDATRATVDPFAGDYGGSAMFGSLATPPSHWDRRFSFTMRDGLNISSSATPAALCQQLLINNSSNNNSISSNSNNNNNNSCRLPSPSIAGYYSDPILQQLISNYHQQQQQQQQHQHHQQQQQQQQQMSHFVATTPSLLRKQRGSTSSSSLAAATRQFDFFPDKAKAAAGNIFRRRSDMSAFDDLPPSSRNSYCVRVEDEGPYGNDETRCFLLTVLSSTGKTAVKCVVCKGDLTVYDKYPLLDGTFFLSPGSYEDCGIDVTNHNRRSYHNHHNHHNHQQQQQQQQQQFLNAVCMGCSNGSRKRVSCLGCGRRWNGQSLVIGTMYNFDVFAATACCSARLGCQRCGVPVRDFPTGGQSLVAPSFSDFCRWSACPRCHAEACHAVKSLSSVFSITQQTSN